MFSVKLKAQPVQKLALFQWRALVLLAHMIPHQILSLLNKKQT